MQDDDQDDDLTLTKTASRTTKTTMTECATLATVTKQTVDKTIKCEKNRQDWNSCRQPFKKLLEVPALCALIGIVYPAAV